MKRMHRFLAALLIVALCLSSGLALAEGKVTTTGSLNLRKGAGLDYASICTIAKGVTLKYDKTSVDDRGVTWYHVSYKNHKGWIASMYTKKGGSSSGGTVTTTAQINLRKGAGVGYDAILTIGKGVTLSYDSTAKDSQGVTWLYVSYKGKTGWISSKYVKAGGGSGGVSGKVTTTGNLNMRKGPGLAYESLFTIGKGVTLKYDKTSVDDRGVTWYRTVYRGKTGWVSAKYAKAGGSSGKSTKKSVVGNTGKSNVHTGPGLSYKSIGVLHKGESAAFLNKTSVDERGVTWYKITWKGKDAWVSSKYTKLQ